MPKGNWAGAQQLRHTAASRWLLAVVLAGMNAAILPTMLKPLAVSAAIPVSPESESGWDNILKPLARKKRPLGSRGGLCALTPARLGTKTELWNLRPLFVWQGAVSQIAVRPVGKAEVLWRYTPTSTHTTQPYSQASYDGSPLQPGQTYEWLIFDQFAGPSSEPTLILPFHVMDASIRSTITTQLQTLETNLQKQSASAEITAQQRTKFFVDRQLPADALQTVFAVKTPSTSLKQAIQTLPSQLCKASGG
ncbi:MAG: hypothetical protein ACAF41_09255 [Leptolyngbya sp. BL-A-14]